jgi:hypothetical protein
MYIWVADALENTNIYGIIRQQTQPILDEPYRRSPQIAALVATAGESCRIIRERKMAAWPQWKRPACRALLQSTAGAMNPPPPRRLSAMEQRSGRKTHPPLKAHQAIHIWPCQLRSTAPSTSAPFHITLGIARGSPRESILPMAIGYIEVANVAQFVGLINKNL